MVPERGTAGKFAKSVFFEERNEIDIYIEDTALGSEKIAAKIYSRVFDGAYKLDQIFPLGGRGAVISKFNEVKDHLDRPSLFVIDGDIYHLTGDHVKDEAGLYRLPFYCIENLMMDPSALHSVIDDEDPIRSEADIIQDFDYLGWKALNETKLKDLFIEYAISRVLNPSEPTISYEVKNLVSGNDGCIDDVKLANRLTDLAGKAISKVGEENYRVTREKILLEYEKSQLDDLDFISGRLLIPFIKNQVALKG